MWFVKTGAPPKPYEDYDPISLLALLVYTARWADPEGHKELHGDDNDDATTIHKERAFGPPTLDGGNGKRLKYDEAHMTGDPVADRWEKQVAMGQTPDW